MTAPIGPSSRGAFLPVQNSTRSFWHTELHQLHNHRTTECLPESCDVLIIGAGYAGAATAYNLVKAQEGNILPDLSIAMLEARGACSGATGRNGGHLRPDLYDNIPAYIERFGIKAAEEYAKYEIDHVATLKKLIQDENIDCDFILTRSCNAYRNQDDAEKARSIYNSLVQLGLKYMDDVQFTDGEAAEGISGVIGAKACSTYTSATLSPYKFIMHLINSALKSKNLNLQTNTPVTGITEVPSGGFVVETPRGSLKARTIVHANNAYVGELLPEYRASIIPCKGICCQIKVPKGITPPLVQQSYIVHTLEGKGCEYLIPRTDGSIIVGGARHQYNSFREQWFNNVDDSILIDSAMNYYDGFMQKTFRGWYNTEAKVHKIWTGVMGYSFDSLPHIGNIPGRPGQIIIAGFNGHGMPVIWEAAKGITKIILEEKTYEDIGLPKIFQTSFERIENAKNGSLGGDIFR